MGRRRQQWRVGDVFVIKLLNGDHVVCQVVGKEAAVLNSATCAFFDQRVSDPVNLNGVSGPRRGDLFSVLFVTRDQLDSGAWEVLGNRPLAIEPATLPYEHLRRSGFVGARVIGSGIVIQFLNAYFGLAPWDDWKEPTYLDSLLISPGRRPAGLILTRADG